MALVVVDVHTSLLLFFQETHGVTILSAVSEDTCLKTSRLFKLQKERSRPQSLTPTCEPTGTEGPQFVNPSSTTAIATGPIVISFWAPVTANYLGGCNSCLQALETYSGFMFTSFGEALPLYRNSVHFQLLNVHYTVAQLRSVTLSTVWDIKS